jgi:hypothetical protein
MKLWKNKGSNGIHMYDIVETIHLKVINVIQMPQKKTEIAKKK